MSKKIKKPETKKVEVKVIKKDPPKHGFYRG